MKDYPNNETLVAVINVIDETKANKDEISTDVILYSPQTLTEEQKAQARANFGITEINNDGGTETIPPVEETTTTEYVYTYDGDKDTDANLATAKTYSDTNLATAKSYIDTELAKVVALSTEEIDAAIAAATANA